MKRKIAIAGAVVLILFVAVLVIIGAFGKGPDTSSEHYRMTLTADGKLQMQPPDRVSFKVVADRGFVTNTPPAK